MFLCGYIVAAYQLDERPRKCTMIIANRWPDKIVGTKTVTGDLDDEAAFTEWMSAKDPVDQEALRDLFNPPNMGKEQYKTWRKKLNQWIQDHGDDLSKSVLRAIKGVRVVTPKIRPLKDRLRRRKREKRLRLVSLVPCKRVDNHTVRLPGGMVLRTHQTVPPEWVITNFHLVEITPYVNRKTRPDQRQLQIHIHVKKACVASSRLRGNYERWLGVDMGVVHTMTFHDGGKWDMPDRSDLENELQDIQRAMSKVRRGNWKWRMLRRKLRKIHKKCVNRDLQAIWKIAIEPLQQIRRLGS